MILMEIHLGNPPKIWVSAYCSSQVANPLVAEVPGVVVPIERWAGVTLAWLLLSVQLALLPLLHALHGHTLTDHHMALGRDQQDQRDGRATNYPVLI